jgi:hypothetical protein
MIAPAEDHEILPRACGAGDCLMSHQIVECPGCLTKLRVKESAKVITLACPRCGEQLAIDPIEPAGPPPRPAVTSPSPQRPASKPVRLLLQRDQLHHRDQLHQRRRVQPDLQQRRVPHPNLRHQDPQHQLGLNAPRLAAHERQQRARMKIGTQAATTPMATTAILLQPSHEVRNLRLCRRTGF